MSNFVVLYEFVISFQVFFWIIFFTASSIYSIFSRSRSGIQHDHVILVLTINRINVDGNGAVFRHLIRELFRLAWLISTATHLATKIGKFSAKIFIVMSGGQRLPVCMCGRASISCLSLGMTKFDGERSITVCHILLKMPGRQFEDHCCPINIYSALLTSHFVERRQTESSPNVN